MEIFWDHYVVVFGIGMLLSLVTSIRVKFAFKKGQQVKLYSGLSGAEVARLIVHKYGLEGVTVEKTTGFLTDHYHPLKKKLFLSPDVYDGKTASAVGVAAHEAGHAIQHAEGYFPLWLRSMLVPVAQIGSRFGGYLILVGLLLFTGFGVSQQESGIGKMGLYIAYGGVAFFGAAVLFSVVTVPVEFNASSRAKRILQEEGVVSTRAEESAVRRVLTAAGLTYVAAAFSALLQLLYWVTKLKKR